MGERHLAVVFLVTKEVDALVPFYRDVLGLTVTQYDPGHSAWFDTGTVRLAIHRPEGEDGVSEDDLRQAQTVMWFRPEEGVSLIAESLTNAGVALLRPRSAATYFYVRDPEGRLLGFHQPESG